MTKISTKKLGSAVAVATVGAAALGAVDAEALLSHRNQYAGLQCWYPGEYKNYGGPYRYSPRFSNYGEAHNGAALGCANRNSQPGWAHISTHRSCCGWKSATGHSFIRSGPWATNGQQTSPWLQLPASLNNYHKSVSGVSHYGA
jgi:hypothetical protein